MMMTSTEVKGHQRSNVTDYSSTSARLNGWQLAKMKKSIPDMSLS